MNEGGISKSGGLLDVGVEMGVIQKSGSFFKFNNELLGQGREAVKIVFDENKKLANQIESEIWKAVKKNEKIPVEVGEKKEE
jgi:recombination protein RecA